jgi:hypothetical protein
MFCFVHTGRNRLSISCYYFDIDFPNIGFGLHFGHSRALANIIGLNYHSGYIHVHHVAILPGITKVHTDQ